MMTRPMTMQRPPRRFAPAQRGLALIIALIFLLLMAMIGVTGMQTTTMQERMAGNARDRNLAFQAAEAALRVAEDELFSSTIPPTHTDEDYYYSEDAAELDANDWWHTSSFWNDNSNVAVVNVDGTGGGRYVVQEKGAFLPSTVSDPSRQQKGAFMYQVTARGVGQNPSTQVFLQTTYKYGSQ